MQTTALNQSERQYDLVGFFSDCDPDTENYGWFRSDMPRLHPDR